MFAQQVREAKKFNEALLNKTKYPNRKLHPSAIYTSRCLSNFTKNLPKPQNSKEINQIFYKLTEEMEDLRITNLEKFSEELKSRFNDLLSIKEKSQEMLLESEEIPPIKIL